MIERIQKILSRAGIASRRKAETMILAGRITVNGQTVTRLGEKADPDRDAIRVDGKRILAVMPRTLYIVLYKPQGYVTTMSDPQGRPTVADLVKSVPERLFPAGRLDYDSEGLLLMTNDGEFAQRIQHPRYEIPKEYYVKVKGAVSEALPSSLRKGADLEDGFFRPLEISLEKRNPGSTWFRVLIHEGKNRVIRRYFEHFGHPATRLIRTAVGGILLEGMKPSEYRYLQKKDVEAFLPSPPSKDEKSLDNKR